LRFLEIVSAKILIIFLINKKYPHYLQNRKFINIFAEKRAN